MSDYAKIWKSIEEEENPGLFRERRHNEFIEAMGMGSGASRRDFLKLVSSAAALGAVGGCSRTPDRIIPYVRQPEYDTPERRRAYATTMPMEGFGTGVLVSTVEGRPIKIDGNPRHPASLGGSNIFGQAALIDLYNPERSNTPRKAGLPISWAQVRAEAGTILTPDKRIAILGVRTTSPFFISELEGFQKRFPNTRLFQYEPAAEHEEKISREVFGQVLFRVYDLAQVERIVSFDDDFLAGRPGGLAYSRGFSKRCRSEPHFQIHMAECSPTLTGTKARELIRVAPSRMGHLALALAKKLGLRTTAAAQLSPEGIAWVDKVHGQLKSGLRTLFCTDTRQSAAVQGLVLWMNQTLGNVGRSVRFHRPIHSEIQAGSISDLADLAGSGGVDLLLILEGNPAYNAPGDLDISRLISRVPNSMHLSAWYDETSRQCNFHFPAAHWLESWGDIQSYDGSFALQQPIVNPLANGKSPADLITFLRDGPQLEGPERLRQNWRGRGINSDEEWSRALRLGVIETGQENRWETPPSIAGRLESLLTSLPPAASGMELIFRADPTIHDGQFSSNAWLQELPKPMSQLCWQNAAFLSANEARTLKLAAGDEIELTAHGRKLTAMAWPLPNHPAGVVSLTFGYGRQHGGTGSQSGYNAYHLRDSKTPWQMTAEDVRKTGKKIDFACTQWHQVMEGRDLIRVGPPVASKPPEQTSLYPGVKYEGYAWGMVIDLNVCTGCKACTVACQIENNTPVVGESEVRRGREMHWIRVDQYFFGPTSHPRVVHQPVPCMHCENAPCEVVCPVGATTHSSEGLNEMTYNRCVGTRYCSNNCPYKVRRFNFFGYSSRQEGILELAHNPEVTVRMRGVMEKCTYCVHKINAARIQSKIENRPIRDGEIIPACEQACPVQAITFGNLNDPESRVAKIKALPGDYTLLPELNARPRTSYLPIRLLESEGEA